MKSRLLAVHVILWGALAVLLCLIPGPLRAGEADVLDVKVWKEKDGYSFEVSVSHADEGWDHYADLWDISTPGGDVLGTRVLLHPHVGEQPFTRSLSGIRIPDSISRVVVRAHDKVHGYGGREMEVELPEE